MSEITTNKNTFSEPVCVYCKHHIFGAMCKAFDRIPNEILTGENDHSKPLKDQGNDIIFKAI